MRETRNVYRILVGKPLEKLSFERQRTRCEDIIKMGFMEIPFEARRAWNWFRTGYSGRICN
jgi:hypothetical protein